jgi:hypothetical protein
MPVDTAIDQICSLIECGVRVGLPSEDVEIGMLFDVLVVEECLARLVRTRNSRRPLIHNLNSEMGRNTSLANGVTCQMSLLREVIKNTRFNTYIAILMISDPATVGLEAEVPCLPFRSS